MGLPVLPASSIDFVFNQMEDRILARCHGGDGALRTLWLTRRLTRAFLQQFGTLLLATTRQDGVMPDQRETLALFEHIEALSDTAALERDRDAVRSAAAGSAPTAVESESPAVAEEAGAASSLSPVDDGAAASDGPTASEGLTEGGGLVAGAAAGGGTAMPEESRAGEAETVLMTRIDVTPRNDRFDLRLFGPEDEAVMLPITRADAHRLLSVLLRTAEHGGWDLDMQVGWIGDGNRLMRGGQTAGILKH